MRMHPRLTYFPIEEGSFVPWIPYLVPPVLGTLSPNHLIPSGFCGSPPGIPFGEYHGFFILLTILKVPSGVKFVFLPVATWKVRTKFLLLKRESVFLDLLISI